MIKTYEIDLDDALVDTASKIFETLGTDIDTAIKLFLTQANLRKGFPFDVTIPQEEEKEDCAVTVAPEISERVAANEALVAQMKQEIGDKAVTPEFDENEDDGTHGDYEATQAEAEPVRKEIKAPAQTAAESTDDDEDEDETTPDNLFDSWDVGEEEDIGCR